jgi:hypothetical protein
MNSFKIVSRELLKTIVLSGIYMCISTTVKIYLEFLIKSPLFWKVLKLVETFGIMDFTLNNPFSYFHFGQLWKFRVFKLSLQIFTQKIIKNYQFLGTLINFLPKFQKGKWFKLAQIHTCRAILVLNQYIFRQNFSYSDKHIWNNFWMIRNLFYHETEIFQISVSFKNIK